MSTPNDTRPIWLTRADLMDECDNLRSICRAQFAAAPADPAEAVLTRLRALGLANRSRPDDEVARAVLVALGYPGGRAAPPPTTTTTP